MARVFLFGDNIDTDQLAPGVYMRGGIEALAEHCLEAVRPGFSGEVRPGDILVAGRNFGAGSSREQAAEALKHLGLSAVVATSFAGIFYRNALNLGLPVLVANVADPSPGPSPQGGGGREPHGRRQAIDGVVDGDEAEIDVWGGRLILADREIALEPIPENVRPMLKAGGLVPYLKQRFAGAS